jgi:putative nucleotidyltransferase with HDIG domain
VLLAVDPVRAITAGELALLGVEAPQDSVWRALVRAMWLHPTVADTIQAVMTSESTQQVVADRAQLGRTVDGGIVVRTVPDVRGREQVREDVSDLLDVRAARRQAELKLAAALADAAPRLSESEREAIGQFASTFVRANLTTNAAESDLRRRHAAESVPPLIVRARRGEIVLRPGEMMTQRHHLLARAMRIQQADDMRTRAAFGTAFFVGLCCLVVYLFGARRVFRRSLRPKDLLFLSVVLLLELTSIVAADAIGPMLPTGIPSSVVYFAVPMALGAMVVRLMLTPDVALLFAVLAALLCGVVVEPGLNFAVVAVLAALTGAAGVSRAQRRSTMMLAGVGAGLVGAFAALTLELFRGALVGRELMYLVGAALSGGVISGVLLVFVAPLLEWAFGYLTDQRLARFADLNHPVLKDLIVHAPGTWHHSVRVAELAEAAAQAVGARTLMARVMALYHDIGKMKQPQLFLENQKGDNPHARLPPMKSAEALRAHVTDGVATARAGGLPEQVVAAIVEHHADNLMEVFYQKAVQTVGDEAGPVDARAFQYAGQPPSSRESAIVMLADQVESAVRSMENPTAEQLADLVDWVVHRASADGTLDECDLSLKDIARLRNALADALLVMHHQRAAE